MMLRNQNVCSKCQKPGHNIRTCGNTPTLPALPVWALSTPAVSEVPSRSSATWDDVDSMSVTPNPPLPKVNDTDGGSYTADELEALWVLFHPATLNKNEDHEWGDTDVEALRGFLAAVENVSNDDALASFFLRAVPLPRTFGVTGKMFEYRDISVNAEWDVLLSRLSSHNRNVVMFTLCDFGFVPITKYVAQSHYATPNVLEALSRSPVPSVREEVAMNPVTPPDTLVRLFREGFPGESAGNTLSVHRLLAGNPSLPGWVLTRLSRSEDASVRIAVAKNPAVTSQILARVWRHPLWGVRSAVARNPRTPKLVLWWLSRRMLRSSTRSVTASNPSTPRWILRSMSREALHIRHAVASNPSLPPRVLARLSHDVDYTVRQAVASNTSTAPGILAELSRDPDPGVRDATLRNPHFISDNLPLSQ